MRRRPFMVLILIPVKPRFSLTRMRRRQFLKVLVIRRVVFIKKVRVHFARPLLIKT